MTCKYFNYISADLWATHMVVLNSMTLEEQKEYIKALDEQFELSLIHNDNISSGASSISSTPSKQMSVGSLTLGDKKFPEFPKAYHEMSVKEKIDVLVANSPPGHQVVLIKEDFTDAELKEMNRMYYRNMYNK
ncbi:uncharacterized protein SAPINGB_P001053 [Magnusiomyces paraingens]|uniref:Uncharacterized protein n=1 Tax=Magnusiomyces paraingens TaxID=2606893 RepID=A0A5E8B5M4_9ASCO|nr:uncharacterized protein SAPINGB_P001053 [Saprochaete ingens]VVT46114.1 unnamed protein product [Saprochaete ingens]